MDLDAEHRPLVSACGLIAHIRNPAVRESRNSTGTSLFFPRCPPDKQIKEETMGRGILLWLLGVPIPIILLLWLFMGR